MVGDIIHINATYRETEFGPEYRNFGIVPKHKHVWGVDKDEPVYDVEFEVVEECPKYPKDIRKIEYYAFCEEYEYLLLSEAENDETCEKYGGLYYKKLDKPKYSLIQPNVICFTIQFPGPVFEQQHKPYFGKIVRLKLKNATKIE